MTQKPEPDETVVVFHCKKDEKAAMIDLSKAEGKKLTQWILENLRPHFECETERK